MLKRVLSIAVVLSASIHTSFAAPDIKECIAPSQPGGGWDFTCRTIANLLVEKNFVKNNIQTVNRPGASGGVAYSYIASKRSDDDSVVIAASTATTTTLAQNKVPGLNTDMVKWIGAIGADYGVIAVGKNSPYQTLTELLDALKTDPNSVKFSGGDIAGGWDHLKILLLAEKYGVTDIKSIKYLSLDSGGAALTQVIGGHTDAFTGDVSETKGYIDSEDIRILAVFADKRLPEPFDKIPTAKEQGLDYIGANWRGFYIPKNSSDETYNWWIETLNSLSQSDEWKTIMQANGLAPFEKIGAEFDIFVKEQVKEITTISKEIGVIK